MNIILQKLKYIFIFIRGLFTKIYLTCKNKNDWKWGKITAIANIILAGIALYAVFQTNNLISDTQQQFKELNRPFVTIEQEMQTIGLNVFMYLKNLGNTNANDLNIEAYYFDTEGIKQNLTKEVNLLNIGTLYPEERKTVVIDNPFIFIEKVKDKTFTISLSYKFSDKCIGYSQSIHHISGNIINTYASTENIEKCSN